jgi:hypothetical protein
VSESEFTHPHPELAETFTAWQQNQDPGAAAELIDAFGRLAIAKVATTYAYPVSQMSGAIGREDLILTGYRALLEGAINYDPTEGKKFSTYVFRNVAGREHTEFMSHAYAVHLPSGVHATVRFLRRCDLAQMEQDEPLLSDAELEALRKAATDPAIPALPYSEADQIPPYRHLQAVWKAESFQAAIEDEGTTTTDDYLGAPSDDEGSAWERAIMITSGNQDHAPDYQTQNARKVRSFLESAIADAYEECESNLTGANRQSSIEFLLLARQVLLLHFGLGQERPKDKAQIALELGFFEDTANAHPEFTEKENRRQSLFKVSRLLKRGLAALRDYAEKMGIDESNF